MNSNTKGLLFIVLGLLSLAWFVYEALGYLSHGGVPAEENPVISLGLTGLKLVMAISFFYSAISHMRKKG
jgi:hypothetical protein